MIGKLVKTESTYHLVVNNKIIASVGDSDGKLQKLSLKNCETIDNGYDLDELAKITYECDPYIAEYLEHEFKKGFQKALEILGDKKYSEDDIIIAMTCMKGQELFYEKTYEETQKSREIYIKNYIKSLQQTEWDVEIIMEEVYDGLDEKAQPQYSKNPKLDADGCLILKRK